MTIKCNKINNIICLQIKTNYNNHRKIKININILSSQDTTQLICLMDWIIKFHRLKILKIHNITKNYKVPIFKIIMVITIITIAIIIVMIYIKNLSQQVVI